MMRFLLIRQIWDNCRRGFDRTHVGMSMPLLLSWLYNVVSRNSRQS